MASMPRREGASCAGGWPVKVERTLKSGKAFFPAGVVPFPMWRKTCPTPSSALVVTKEGKHLGAVEKGRARTTARDERSTTPQVGRIVKRVDHTFWRDSMGPSKGLLGACRGQRGVSKLDADHNRQLGHDSGRHGAGYQIPSPQAACRLTKLFSYPCRLLLLVQHAPAGHSRHDLQAPEVEPAAELRIRLHRRTDLAAPRTKLGQVARMGAGAAVPAFMA